MNSERGGIKLITLIIILFLMLTIIFVSVMLLKDNKDIVKKSNNPEIYLENSISTNNPEEGKDDKNLQEIKAGGRIYKVKVLENGEIMAPLDMIEKILEAGNIHYAKDENIITIDDIVETRTTIDIATGEISGRNMHGFEIEKCVLPILPEVIGDTVYLPFKFIYETMQENYKSFFYPEQRLLLYGLNEYQVELRKDFPYYIEKEFTMEELGWKDGKYTNGAIFKVDNKYGIINYVVEIKVKRDKNNKIISRQIDYIGYSIELDAEYDEYMTEIGYISENKFIAMKQGESGIFYNFNTGEISERYDMIEKIEDNNYKVMKNGKYGLYGVTETIYDNIWYEEGETTGSANMQVTSREIYGSINGEKFLLKKLNPSILCID